jgi:hypothetical protein
MLRSAIKVIGSVNKAAKSKSMGDVVKAGSDTIKLIDKASKKKKKKKKPTDRE